MSAIVRGALAVSKDLPPTERLTLVAVSAYVGKANRAFPSLATLADLVGVTTRTIQRALASLVKRGLLLVARRLGRKSNLYSLPTGDTTDGAGDTTDGAGCDDTGQRKSAPEVDPTGLEEPKGLEARKRPSWRDFIPKTKNPKPAPGRPQYGYPDRRGAALPPAAGADQCPKHQGSLAANCGPCRSEALGGAA